ncbi:hypothetical protein SNEBB_001709 [Seison nebaliae]|nr:hypothetical protein SNEBB_001709 [Seison nebaliae]
MWIFIFSLLVTSLQTYSQETTLKWIVDEEMPIGTSIGNISIGLGKRQVFSWTVCQNLYSMPLFHLNSTTGEVKTTARIDRESFHYHCFLAKSYPINNLAHYNEFKTNKRNYRIEIIINDINDNAPQLSLDTHSNNYHKKIKILIDGEEKEYQSLNFFIRENSPKFTFIGNVDADDYDIGPNANLTYEFLSKNSMFDIDKFSGHIYSKNIGDYEKQNEYRQLLRISDNSINERQLYLDILLIINIIDLNDEEPYFDMFAPYQVHVQEETLVHEKNTLFHLTVFDCDTFESSKNIHLFIIDHRTHRLSNQLISRFQSVEKSLKFNKFKFSIDLMKSFDREIDGNRLIFNLIAIDLMEEEQKDNLMNWNNYLSSLSHLHNSTTLMIDIEDINDNYPSMKLLTNFPLLSTEKDDKVHKQMVILLKENMPINQVIAQVKGEDKDNGRNSKLSYYIKHQSNGNDCHSSTFGINKETGEIFIVKQIDREKCDFYSFDVICSDNGLPNPLKSSLSIQISISDINDNPPRFMGDRFRRFSINRKQKSNELISSLLVADNDLSSTLTAQITNGNDDNDNDDGFNLKAFFIKVSQQTTEMKTYVNLYVNYEKLTEKKNFYLFQLELNDGIFHDRISVRIDIHELNEHSPKLIEPKNFKCSLIENLAINLPICQLKAIDEDKKSTKFSFKILSVMSTVGFVHYPFKLHKNTGVISLKEKVDRELIDEYQLNILIIDDGYPIRNSSYKITIKVNDTNDNAPKFINNLFDQKLIESKSIAIDENLGFNKRIAKLIAIDEDMKPTINFKISPSNSFGNDRHDDLCKKLTIENDIEKCCLPNISMKYFHIHSTNGILRTSSDEEIDYEKCQIYLLHIMADDSVHQTSLPLIVNINDVNDNSPQFNIDILHLYLREHEENNTILFKLNATDADRLDENRAISYDILSNPIDQNGDKLFYIFKTRTNLSVNSVLLLNKINDDIDDGINDGNENFYLILSTVADYEQLNNETEESIWQIIDIRARSQNLVSSLRIFIHLLDINDNSPIIPFTNITFINFIDHNCHSLTKSIGRLYSSDIDVNDTLNYQLIDSSISNIVTLDSLTGQLFIISTSEQLKKNEMKKISYYSKTFQYIVSDGIHQNIGNASILIGIYNNNQENLSSISLSIRVGWKKECYHTTTHVFYQIWKELEILMNEKNDFKNILIINFRSVDNFEYLIDFAHYLHENNQFRGGNDLRHIILFNYFQRLSLGNSNKCLKSLTIEKKLSGSIYSNEMCQEQFFDDDDEYFGRSKSISSQLTTKSSIMEMKDKDNLISFLPLQSIKLSKQERIGKLKNPCLSFPCLNNGTCITDKSQLYVCHCGKGKFVGRRCEFDIDNDKCTTKSIMNKNRLLKDECESPSICRNRIIGGIICIKCPLINEFTPIQSSTTKINEFNSISSRTCTQNSLSFINNSIGIQSNYEKLRDLFFWFHSVRPDAMLYSTNLRIYGRFEIFLSRSQLTIRINEFEEVHPKIVVLRNHVHFLRINFQKQFLKITLTNQISSCSLWKVGEQCTSNEKDEIIEIDLKKLNKNFNSISFIPISPHIFGVTPENYLKTYQPIFIGCIGNIEINGNRIILNSKKNVLWPDLKEINDRECKRDSPNVIYSTKSIQSFDNCQSQKKTSSLSEKFVCENCKYPSIGPQCKVNLKNETFFAFSKFSSFLTYSIRENVLWNLPVTLSFNFKSSIKSSRMFSLVLESQSDKQYTVLGELENGLLLFSQSNRRHLKRCYYSYYLTNDNNWHHIQLEFFHQFLQITLNYDRHLMIRCPFNFPISMSMSSLNFDPNIYLKNLFCLSNIEIMDGSQINLLTSSSVVMKHSNLTLDWEGNRICEKNWKTNIYQETKLNEPSKFLQYFSTYSMKTFEYCGKYCSGKNTQSCDIISSYNEKEKKIECFCKIGWFGNQCNEHICDRNTNVCGAHGRCESSENELFSCNCKLGWFGRLCDMELPKLCDRNYWTNGELRSPNNFYVYVNLKDKNINFCRQCQCDWNRGFEKECDLTSSSSLFLKNEINNDNFKCKCRDGFYESSLNECSSCNCHLYGSHSMICNRYNGSCSCKSGVVGRRCDSCLNKWMELSETGAGCISIRNACPRERDNREQIWPRTNLGLLATISCPITTSIGKIYRYCDMNNGWLSPDYSNCMTKEMMSSGLTQIILELYKNRLTLNNHIFDDIIQKINRYYMKRPKIYENLDNRIINDLLIKLSNDLIKSVDNFHILNSNTIRSFISICLNEINQLKLIDHNENSIYKELKRQAALSVSSSDVIFNNLFQYHSIPDAFHSLLQTIQNIIDSGENKMKSVSKPQEINVNSGEFLSNFAFQSVSIAYELNKRISKEIGIKCSDDFPIKCPKLMLEFSNIRHSNDLLQSIDLSSSVLIGKKFNEIFDMRTDLETIHSPIVMIGYSKSLDWQRLLVKVKFHDIVIPSPWQNIFMNHSRTIQSYSSIHINSPMNSWRKDMEQFINCGIWNEKSMKWNKEKCEIEKISNIKFLPSNNLSISIQCKCKIEDNSKIFRENFTDNPNRQQYSSGSATPFLLIGIISWNQSPLEISENFLLDFVILVIGCICSLILFVISLILNKVLGTNSINSGKKSQMKFEPMSIRIYLLRYFLISILFYLFIDTSIISVHNHHDNIWMKYIYLIITILLHYFLISIFIWIFIEIILVYYLTTITNHCETFSITSSSATPSTITTTPLSISNEKDNQQQQQEQQQKAKKNEINENEKKLDDKKRSIMILLFFIFLLPLIYSIICFLVNRDEYPNNNHLSIPFFPISNITLSSLDSIGLSLYNLTIIIPILLFSLVSLIIICILYVKGKRTTDKENDNKLKLMNIGKNYLILLLLYILMIITMILSSKNSQQQQYSNENGYYKVFTSKFWYISVIVILTIIHMIFDLWSNRLSRSRLIWYYTCLSTHFTTGLCNRELRKCFKKRRNTSKPSYYSNGNRSNFNHISNERKDEMTKNYLPHPNYSINLSEAAKLRVVSDDYYVSSLSNDETQVSNDRTATPPEEDLMMMLDHPDGNNYQYNPANNHEGQNREGEQEQQSTSFFNQLSNVYYEGDDYKKSINQQITASVVPQMHYNHNSYEHPYNQIKQTSRRNGEMKLARNIVLSPNRRDTIASSINSITTIDKKYPTKNDSSSTLQVAAIRAINNANSSSYAQPNRLINRHTIERNSDHRSTIDRIDTFNQSLPFDAVTPMNSVKQNASKMNMTPDKNIRFSQNHRNGQPATRLTPLSELAKKLNRSEEYLNSPWIDQSNQLNCSAVTTGAFGMSSTTSSSASKYRSQRKCRNYEAVFDEQSSHNITATLTGSKSSLSQPIEVRFASDLTQISPSGRLATKRLSRANYARQQQEILNIDSSTTDSDSFHLPNSPQRRSSTETMIPHLNFINNGCDV